ncbi:MAG TPA: ATP-binding protein, partial [Caulobacteraceae bacterium]|nr:ATP-binding protein [Caulobacteraceae bacterium]
MPTLSAFPPLRRRRGSAPITGVESSGRLPDRGIAASGLEAAEVAVFRSKPRAGLVELDAHGRAMFDLPTSGAIATGELLARVVEWDRERLAAALAAPSADASFCIEVRVQPREAPGRMLLCRGRGAQGVFIDITERPSSDLRAEYALRRNSDPEPQAAGMAERDRLWRYSRDIILVMDTDGIGLAANPALTRILGWLPEEIVGLDVLELIHPEDHETVLTALADVLNRDNSVPPEPSADSDVFEIRCQHKSGRYEWISWVAGYEGAEGRTLYATGRLISGEKAAAAELVLAQEALRQSQKLEAMGQLTGGVAHDFNNLLTPIIGGLDMLQRHEVGGEREQRLIDGALQSAERAKVLVQRLLAFARRQPLQPAAIDITALFSGMKELIASTAGPRIRIEFDVETDLAPARADANQLEMALLNLAVNARDAMPNGGLLAISAGLREVLADNRHSLAPGEYVLIGVADTGVGMDEETLRRCVEPFFSTKGVGRGTGLGLSMVHGLASQLGGALEIESAAGRGSRFTLWLPASQRLDHQATGPLAAPEARPVRGLALVVDDEDLVRASTADMLAELGYDVIEASCA